jgi:uncharacterized sulfatase
MNNPNVLLITSDQQHWSTIGVLNKEIKTPNLDRLAAGGTLFDRAYCPNPTCTPSRSSIITGQYPSQHGARSLGTKLLEDRHTLGDDLQKAGYRTALIGKAHFQPLRGTDEFVSLESYPLLQDLSYWQNHHGPFYGFEHIELTRNHTNEAHVGQHYALWLEENGCENWRDYFLPPTGTLDPSVKHRWPIPEEFHYNSWIAERTNAKLREYNSDGEQFFLWSSFLDPHPEYLVPEPWASMYDPQQLSLPALVPGEHRRNPPHFQKTQETAPDFSYLRESGMSLHGYHSHVHLSEHEQRRNMATYYGMISMMDHYIGCILDELDNLGLAESTLVVFTSDHGHLFGQHGLHAKGGFMYEDLIRVPMIARHPGTIPANCRSDAIQSLVDFAPTILSLINAPVPLSMSGVDQSGVWSGADEHVRDHAICEFRHEPTTIHQKTYVDERYKITVYYNQPYGEIFDLLADPDELHNLWDDPVSQDLKTELLLKYAWAELGKEPLYMPRVWHA